MTMHNLELHRRLGSVLVLEDEALVSLLMEDQLRALGASAILVCSTPGQARQALDETKVDCAILDVQIGTENSFGVADMLAARNTPFMFSSALSADGIDERHRHRPLLTKPFADDDLRRALLQAFATS